MPDGSGNEVRVSCMHAPPPHPPPPHRILTRLQFESGAAVNGPDGAPRAPHLTLSSFQTGMVCSKSHLPPSLAPAFHTLRMGFSLWSVRPLCGFPTGFLFVVGGQTLSCRLLPGMRGVCQRGTRRVLFYVP